MTQNTSAHSENQVSAYFTSVHILSIEKSVTNKKEAVTPAKRKYILDLQVSKYGLFAALLHTGRDRTPVKKQLMPN